MDNEFDPSGVFDEQQLQQTPQEIDSFEHTNDQFSQQPPLSNDDDVTNAFGFDSNADAPNSSNAFDLFPQQDQQQQQQFNSDSLDMFGTYDNQQDDVVEEEQSPAVDYSDNPLGLSKEKLEWNAKKKLQLEKRAAEQKKAFADSFEQGKNDLIKFQQKRQEQIARNKKASIAEEKQNKEELDKTIQTGTTWEKVAKYSDLKPKHDIKATQQIDNTERMRTLLIDLKNDKNPPKSATGSFLG